jgi:soluble lytic murein transglycosylase-like protein
MTYPSAVDYAAEDLLYEEYQQPFVDDRFGYFNEEPISEEITEYDQADDYQFEDVSYEPITYYQDYQESYESPQYQTYYEVRLYPLTFAPIAVIAISLLLGLISLGLIKPVEELIIPDNQPTETNTEPQPAPVLVGTGIAPLFTPAVQHWAPQISEWATEWNLDPNLVATVMQIESCGDPGAASVAGAMGLFQVMPFHFEPGEDGYDPQTNANRGLAYLHQALQARGGEPRLALAGYNGGITGAKRPENQWPSETQRYVRWGTGIYEDAVAGKQQSSHLEEWLARGGSGLCERASARLGLSQ